MFQNPPFSLLVVDTEEFNAEPFLLNIEITISNNNTIPETIRSTGPKPTVNATIKKPMAGANLQTVLEGMRTDMRKAAENLEFEEAAKLRDEIQRLEAVDLAVADDPLARQSAIEAISNTDKPRSTAGRGGTRAYRGKSKPKLN